MPAYRCFFLDAADRISAAKDFASENDWTAIADAKRLFADVADRYGGAEVWRGPRRLWSSTREKP